MKKVKLLPFLLVAPMLASCGLRKPSQPRFAKVTDADKVAGDKFIDETLKLYNEMDFVSEKAIPSSIAKVESKYSRKSELLRKNKNIRGQEYLENEIATSKLDTKNKVVLYEHSDQIKSSVNISDHIEATNSNDKETDVFQVAKVDGADFVITVNKEAQEFSKVSKLEGDVKAEKVVDNVAKEKIGEFSAGYHGYNLGDLVEAYATAKALDNQEEVEKYTFYKKDKVYTVEYKSEVEDKEVKIAEKVVAKETTKKLYKAQVDFTKGKIKSLIWSTYESEVKYVAAYSTSDSYGSFVCAKDDVQKFNWKASEVVTYEHKDLKLKALDVSKFTKLGEVW